MFATVSKLPSPRTEPGPSWDQSSVVDPAAPLPEFVAWLKEAKQTIALSAHTLWLLYGEYCLDTSTDQLTKGQFFRRIRAAGIERYREPVRERHWRYRVRSADPLDLADRDKHTGPHHTVFQRKRSSFRPEEP